MFSHILNDHFQHLQPALASTDAWLCILSSVEDKKKRIKFIKKSK